MATKPPIGIMPKQNFWLFLNQIIIDRIYSIQKAKKRYKAAGMPYPKQWEEEIRVLRKIQKLIR